jgi:DNA-binding MarR family transcriptional regulator
MKNDCKDDSLLQLISMTAQVMRSFADQWLKKYDLTLEQLKILKTMDVEDGQTQSSLCLVTRKSAANITRLLDRLENKNYVERRKNPEDRRASLVFLTPEGLRIREKVRDGFDEMRGAILQDIDPAKYEQTIDVLNMIKDRVENVSVDKG